VIERSWMRFLDSLSNNLKSKTCTEPGRSIQNRKWLGLWLIAFMVVMVRAGAETQQPKNVPRIGYLDPASPEASLRQIEAFRKGLAELGYVEGKNIVIEYRYGDGKRDRLSAVASELVQRQVDVIVTGSTPGVEAAKNATNTIPIIFATIGDPVRSGLVESLARPGGNITGLTIFSPELGGKRLELLKETAPKITRVAFIWSTMNPGFSFAEAEAAGKPLGVKVQSVQIRDVDNIESAFEKVRKLGSQAFTTAPDPVMRLNRRKLLDFAAKNQLPAMYGTLDFVDAGGLMSYAPNTIDLYRRAATYVDKILKGAKPANLPVEQPTKFEFIINLKAAKQIGLTIPPNVLARADRVIK
jgi:putative tryptophan/tyrosine transport system substrate-binding protein